jgi:hypothetical protein
MSNSTFNIVNKNVRADHNVYKTMTIKYNRAGKALMPTLEDMKYWSKEEFKLFNAVMSITNPDTLNPPITK